MRANKTIGLALLAGCCLSSVVRAEDPIDITLRSVFIGSSEGQSGVEPMKAFLHDNVGPADIRLEIDAPGSKTVYFTNLAFGQSRSIDIYVPKSNWEGAKYNLTAKIYRDNDRSSFTTFHVGEMLPRNGFQDSTEHAVLKLSKNRDGLRLHTKNGPMSYQVGATSNVNPFVGSVSSAPERPIAYRRFSCVLLGPGSDKLSDGAVLALKEYVLEGGVLVMNLPLTDNRWQHFAPATEGMRYAGLGEVSVFGEVTPEPSQGLTQEEREVNDVLSKSTTLRKSSAFNGGRGQMGYVPPSSESTSDPFATTLPPFGKVLGVLASYFLVVVPINFLILKRLRHPELTWVTAPILAVAFAAVLFRGTKSLYSVPTSTVTRGTLVVQQGVSEGMFEGETDLFLPHSGSIALGLKNVDAIGVWLDDSAWGNSDRQYEAPTVIDRGTLDIPSFHTANLSFRELHFSQRVAAQDWVVFRKGPRVDGVTPVYVENHSPYTISDASLNVGPLSESLGDIAPGASVEMDTASTPDSPVVKSSDSAEGYPNQLESSLRNGDRAFLVGTMNDLPVGPQVGNRVKSRTNIAIAAFPPSDLDLKP